MKINVEKNSKADVVVMGQFEDKPLSKEAKGLKILKGEFKEIKILNTTSGDVLFIGLGKSKDFDLEVLRKASGVAAKRARDEGYKSLATTLHSITIRGKTAVQKAQAATEGTVLGLYDYTNFKTDKSKIKEISSFTLIGSDAGTKNGAEIGRKIAESTNYSRDLVNGPANVITPTYIAKEAQKLAKKYKLKIKIIEKAEMKKLGMGALIGVSQGAAQPPKFIILEKKGKGDLIALCGKGITFDSGGLQVKPGAYMNDMKMDMAGAAAVLGAVRAACELGLKVNLLGAIATCENMSNGYAQKQGDIVKAYNGKTIEIGHTDAEGRLILADTLSYVSDKHKPKAMIDFATLTGAMVYALGYETAGIFGNDNSLMNKMVKAGEDSQDRMWKMPLYDEYKERMKSGIADLSNMSSGPKGGEAGACTAAAFLSNFVEGNWAHVDIAGTAFLYENKEYLNKGATGSGVRMSTYLLQSWR